MENDSIQNQVNNQSNDGVALNSLKNKLGTFLGAGNRRFILGGAVIILVVLISVFAFSKKTQIVPQKVSPNAKDALLVTVGDQKIYKSDVQKAAKEQYVSTAIDNKVLQVFLDLAIEHAILDQEASKLGIKLKEEDLKTGLYKNFSTSSANLVNVSNLAKYEALKQRIFKEQIESREVYIIGIWLPPGSDPNLTKEERELLSVQVQESQNALSDAENRLRSGEVPLVIAKSLYNKYSSLKQTLALNGYRLFYTSDENNLTKPRVYTYDKNNQTSLYQTIFSMEINQVKKVVTPDNTGGFVIKLVSKNNSENKSYEQWLNKKRTELVKVYNKL